jgi:hypothetical protein
MRFETKNFECSLYDSQVQCLKANFEKFSDYEFYNTTKLFDQSSYAVKDYSHIIEKPSRMLSFNWSFVFRSNRQLSPFFLNSFESALDNFIVCEQTAIVKQTFTLGLVGGLACGFLLLCFNKCGREREDHSLEDVTVDNALP